MTNFDRIIRCYAAPYNKEGVFQNVSKLIEVKSKLVVKLLNNVEISLFIFYDVKFFVLLG